MNTTTTVKSWDVARRYLHRIRASYIWAAAFLLTVLLVLFMPQAGRYTFHEGGKGGVWIMDTQTGVARYFRVGPTIELRMEVHADDTRVSKAGIDR